MPFQIKTKNIFLTYAQSDFTKEETKDFLTQLLEPTYIIVARELHQDGMPHIHAYCALENPVRTRNERYFDYKTRHPNIVSPRNIKKTVEYIKKGGDFIEEGTLPTEKRKWSELHNASTKEEFFDLVKEISPRDYYINMERIQYAANQKFKYVIPDYISQFNNFIIPNNIQEWEQQRNNVSELGTKVPRNPLYPPRPHGVGELDPNRLTPSS